MRAAASTSGAASRRSTAKRSCSRPWASRVAAVRARTSAGSYGRRRAPAIGAGREATCRVATWRASRSAGPGRDDAVLVDPRQLGAERARHALPLRPVARPHAHGRAAGAPVGGVARGVADQRDRLGLPRRLDDGEHRPGRRLAQDPGVRRHAPQHRGRVERPAQPGHRHRAAAHQLRAAGHGLGDQLLDQRQVRGRGERADLGRLECRVADVQALRALAQQPHQRLGDRGHADEPPDRGGMAPAGGERGPQRGSGDLLDRRAVEHEHRALRGRRGDGDDARADVSQRAGGLLARRQREQLLGDAGAQERQAQALAGERRGGDEHDAVARQQRGADLQGGLRPGRARAAQHADHPARSLHAPRASPSAHERGAAEPAVGEGFRPVVGERAEPGDRGQDLAQHRLGARPSRLLRDQQRELVQIVEHQPRRAPHVPRPGGSRHRGPERLRLRGTGRELAHAISGGRLHHPQRLAGGRRARLERPPGHRPGR